MDKNELLGIVGGAEQQQIQPVTSVHFSTSYNKSHYPDYKQTFCFKKSKQRFTVSVNPVTLGVVLFRYFWAFRL